MKKEKTELIIEDMNRKIIDTRENREEAMVSSDREMREGEEAEEEEEREEIERIE